LNENMYLGHVDWRLPNELEVGSLRNYGIGLYPDHHNWLASYGFNNLSDYPTLMWSSTIVEDWFLGWPQTNGIWVGGGYWEASYPVGHAWPVRGGVFP
jgi:hypothetical protein